MIRDKKKIGLLAKKSLLIGEKKELEVKIQQLEIPNYRSPKILFL